ncbi:MAG: DNA-binding response regulator [Limnochordia bacterium]|jgi:menaquinone-dependent protoporphyrinogen IX oxidase|nr:DNA-binding response regulator [Limnochordia bacterium]MDD2629723.1 DNA-binding response regulator [Limnochordia bacterium]MDD2756934.1 hypothetical protein [Methanothrix sp.]MDD4517423.1 DNA-binding response regulator [Limnochordia bacterium]
MKRVIIIHSDEGNLEPIAEVIRTGLKEEPDRARVEIVSVAACTSPFSVRPYDLVCIGSPVRGLFGGRIAPDVVNLISRCNGIEGKRCAVFVTKKLFGTNKALQQMMALLEKQGALVQDFDVLSCQGAEEFGRRLLNLLE